MTYKRAPIPTLADIDNAVEAAANDYQNAYLDYLNDFLTLEGYARFYGIKTATAERIVNIGRKIHNQRTGG